jgi:quercetin dioxygenase-like cupin family protein
MNREEVEKNYKSKGLDVEYGKDDPGTKYKPHRHEQTFLYTLSGSLKIKLEDDNWVEVRPYQEFIVDAGKLHEAVVGENGWEYVAAWNEEEAKKYEVNKSALA